MGATPGIFDWKVFLENKNQVSKRCFLWVDNVLSISLSSNPHKHLSLSLSLSLSHTHTHTLHISHRKKSFRTKSNKQTNERTNERTND